MPRCQQYEFQISEIPNLQGYVVIVTGGNGGVGYETTLQLALHGARVYIASRSADRVNDAIRKMKNASQSPLDVHFLKLDLQDLDSVKASAAEFREREPKLDILINNAGIMASPYQLTKDGHELQWQTCFLAHHAFTLSLLPLLKAAAQQHPHDRDRVRVVNVASDAAFFMGPKMIDLQDPNMTDVSGQMAPWKRYSQSKQAVIVMSNALNERYRHQGITFYSLHPGIIKSNLQSHDTTLMGTFTRLGVKFAPTSSPLDGARTSLYCATSSLAPNHSGEYFVPFGKVDVDRPAKWTRDPQFMARFWQLADLQLRNAGYLVEY